MATSIEKLVAMRPQVTQELETLLMGSHEVGPLLRPVLGFVRPLLDRKVDAWLELPPEQIDQVLGELAAMLARLRSDDAPPIDLEPAALEAGTVEAQPAPSSCGYREPYGSACDNPYPCQHHARPCSVCGDPATHGCTVAGSMVCGFPLCDDHPTCTGH